MPRRSSVSTWSVLIDIPGFAGVARLYPELRAFLTRTRCRITGTGDTWLPTGWLLSGAPRRVVKWPGTNEPLVKFEQANEADGHAILDSELRVSKGPVWPCRIGTDGMAREIIGRVVRPGRRYILLSAAQLPSDHPFLAPCDVDCTNINAWILTVPNTLTSQDMNWLSRWGLYVARTVRIWPSGLSGRKWDGEGYSERLTTETPCFGILHDHPLEAYSLRLDKGAETVIEANQVGSPVFVKISPLPAGRHTLSVKARRGYQQSSVVSSLTAAEGIVTLDVREPEPWIPGSTLHTGLAVSLDPHDPTLDAFWEGNVGVSIFGPAGHHVTCAITLANARGKELLSDPIGTFELPVTPDEWLNKFLPFGRDERREGKYLEAASGRLQIRGEELGEYALPLERHVKAVRWVCGSINRATMIRLIDDTGMDDVATCRFLSFRHPAEPVNLTADIVEEGFQVQPGGLFVAVHREFIDTIVVSTLEVQGRFQGLIVEPELNLLNGGSVPVKHILQFLRLWSEARVVGPSWRSGAAG